MSDNQKFLKLRQDIQAKRKALSPEECAAVSEKIAERLWLSLKNVVQRKIALYRALPGEVDPKFLIEKFFKKNSELHFPRISDFKSRAMEMIAVTQKDLEKHPWKKTDSGIEEPSGKKILPPQALELVLVPGLAFGLSGERIGHGYGFYDRYLQRCPDAYRVGICFDFQISPTLEQAIHDQPMDWVISERREYQNHRIKNLLASSSQVP